LSVRSALPATLLALALVAGCRSTRPPAEEVPARQADVVAALYKQLDAVLARYEALADEAGEGAVRERGELLDRARRIRLRIVHFDPNADLRALAGRVPDSPDSPDSRAH